jgi:FkbH-like protein
MDKIKLVIWDLDETFWKGTLSEEGVEKIENNINVVKELTSRGIMNSIVSKNTFIDAKEKLEEYGVWDYFVFPKIEWSPKGMLIKQTISQCQLRDTNVLFIDDNHLNLKEASFYNPEINTKTPEYIDVILSENEFKGKNDIKHIRLNQYKILEKKNHNKKNFSSNIQFLEASNIKIRFIENTYQFKDRIHELIDRTNQLNFTKKRLSLLEVEQLINNSNLEINIIEVKDNYGDYGIVGLYALDLAKNKLEHFVFSCRIINLGVAQYIYAKLNFPNLDIVPDVSEGLNKTRPSWITEYKEATVENSKSNTENRKFLFKGGCDLDQMLYYLNGNNIDVIKEVNYVNSSGCPVHQEHTQVLLDSQHITKHQTEYLSNHIPFADKDFYNTKVFDNNYDCLIYSVLMDYTQEIYFNELKNMTLPFGGPGEKIWTVKENKKQIIEKWSKRKVKSINNKSIQFFSDNFQHKGKISSQQFINNLNELRKKIPSDIPIIFVNGSEIQSVNVSEKIAGTRDRHIKMNHALDKFISETEGTYLLDLRKIVVDKNQLLDNIRHYNRVVYQKMAEELLSILNLHVDNSIDRNINHFSLLKLRLIVQGAINKIKIFFK